MNTAAWACTRLQCWIVLGFAKGGSGNRRRGLDSGASRQGIRGVTFFMVQLWLKSFALFCAFPVLALLITMPCNAIQEAVRLPHQWTRQPAVPAESALMCRMTHGRWLHKQPGCDVFTLPGIETAGTWVSSHGFKHPFLLAFACVAICY